MRIEENQTFKKKIKLHHLWFSYYLQKKIIKYLLNKVLHVASCKYFQSRKKTVFKFFRNGLQFVHTSQQLF